MDAQEFIKAAIDPDQWLAKSAALRRAGNRLWDTFFEVMLRGAAAHRAPEAKAADRLWSEAFDYLTSSKFLYGLSLETAFKADILRRSPVDVELKFGADGSGVIQSAEIRHFGIQLGSGHNLEQLGQKTGILSLDGNVVFRHESDLRALRDILRHLSEVIYWSGRYPVPTRSGEGHKPSPDIPAKVFGHYIRDWIDPVLDHFQGAHAPPDDWAESMSRIASLVKSSGVSGK